MIKESLSRFDEENKLLSVNENNLNEKTENEPNNDNDNLNSKIYPNNFKYFSIIFLKRNVITFLYQMFRTPSDVAIQTASILPAGGGWEIFSVAPPVSAGNFPC